MKIYLIIPTMTMKYSGMKKYPPTLKNDDNSEKNKDTKEYANPNNMHTYF